MQTEAPTPSGASVITNVLQVLRCFTAEAPLQGVTEISRQVGLHKSSVSRILATLEDERIVERDARTRKFRLGIGLIAIAGPLLAHLDVRRLAVDEMYELAAQSHETVALSLWDDWNAVTVEQITSPQLVKHTSVLGSRYASPRNATVQVFLAEHLRLHGELPMERYADETASCAAALPERIAEVAERGYAVNLGESSPEECGFSAPIRDHRGETCAALLIAAPRFRVTAPDAERLGLLCRDAAERISRRLGWSESALS